MTEQIKKISVALMDSDIHKVSVLASVKGLNFSSALRVIIREWDELTKQERVRITELGREALEQSSKE